MERIQVEASNNRKVRKLVHILTYKGKKAFDYFLKALATSNQDHVVTELQRQQRNINEKLGRLFYQQHNKTVHMI